MCVISWVLSGALHCYISGLLFLHMIHLFRFRSVWLRGGEQGTSADTLVQFQSFLLTRVFKFKQTHIHIPNS